MIIRRERPDDHNAVGAVHAEAFAGPGVTVPAEVGLVDDLRASNSWIHELSLVAEAAGEIVGHVVCSRARLDDRIDVLGLGPLGVRRDPQRSGVGLALMHAVLGAADALDEPVVCLLGNPAYYGRFGFVPASSFGIIAPDSRYGAHFQARLLSAATAEHVGTFRYADAFDGL